MEVLDFVKRTRKPKNSLIVNSCVFCSAPHFTRRRRGIEKEIMPKHKVEEKCKTCGGKEYTIEHEDFTVGKGTQVYLRPIKVPCPACSVTPNTTEV